MTASDEAAPEKAAAVKAADAANPAAVSQADVANFDGSQIEFVTRGVSDLEVAAVTAVLRGLLQEESDQLRRAPDRARSAWDVGQRAIRSPLEPGAGRWRGFAG